jgi:cytochrome c oxidase cbb3-type subunit II
MNRLPYLFLGIFGVFAFAWIGLILLPYKQLGHLKPEVNPDTGDVFPQSSPGLALAGSRVYAANGCAYCHTQQIRPAHLGGDINRKWGARQTVARDYMYEQPVFLGSSRMGSDLANVGARIKDASQFHQLLYNPHEFYPGGNMPPYRFLYKKQKIVGKPSPNALKLGRKTAPKAGYEIVPTQEAQALVAYLMSLNKDYSLPEAR